MLDTKLFVSLVQMCIDGVAILARSMSHWWVPKNTFTGKWLVVMQGMRHGRIVWARERSLSHWCDKGATEGHVMNYRQEYWVKNTLCKVLHPELIQGGVAAWAELRSPLSWCSSVNFSSFRNLSGWDNFPPTLLHWTGVGIYQVPGAAKRVYSVPGLSFVSYLYPPCAGLGFDGCNSLVSFGLPHKKTPNFTHCNLKQLNLVPSANSHLMLQEILWE